MDPATFELLSPSRFVSFTFPNPITTAAAEGAAADIPHQTLLRIAVLDSPITIPSSPSSSSHHHHHHPVAAMLVPIGREHDWIFSTQAGHLQLLLSSSCSRLILVGNPPSKPHPQPYTRQLADPDPDALLDFQNSIMPLLLALSPRSLFLPGVPTIPFLSYDDQEIARIVPVRHLVGPTVGEMLVEDVELDGGELRRRLRFKRMPNLVQSQVRLLNPNIVDVGSLVQPYLGPMAAALSLLAPDLGPGTKALCLGVGGGALLMCLRRHFGFSVTGVEVDDVVVSIAKQHFGLIEDEFLKIVVGNAIELMEFRDKDCFTSGAYDVIMVDLDSGDALSGFFAPSLEFTRESVLSGVRSVLREKGIMVINVIPPNESFYRRLIDSLHEIFDELYEIDVGNGENYVLIAAVSIVGLVENECKGRLLDKLKQVGVDAFVDCIKKI